jgi:hypothetical protein
LERTVRMIGAITTKARVITGNAICASAEPYAGRGRGGCKRPDQCERAAWLEGSHDDHHRREAHRCRECRARIGGPGHDAAVELMLEERAQSRARQGLVIQQQYVRCGSLSGHLSIVRHLTQACKARAAQWRSLRQRRVRSFRQ